MPSFASHLLFTAAIGFCLLCCGCPTRPVPGGDPEVWHDVSIEGTAEILSVSQDADNGAEISIQFTYEGGHVDEKPVDGLELASIAELPEGYQPAVGDKMRLKLDLHYKRKMSVGPPDYLHSNLDSRKYTYLGVGAVAGVQKPVENEKPVENAPPVEVEKPQDNEKTVGKNDAGETENNVVGSSAHNTGNEQTDKLVWETTGGGQIRFTITPDADNYKIHVDEFGPHLPVDLDLSAKDGKPFEAVEKIFLKADEFRLKEIPVDPSIPHPPTGSWTSVMFYDAEGKEIMLDRRSSKADFRSIYDFVKATADKHQIAPLEGFDPPPIPPGEMDDDSSKKEDNLLAKNEGAGSGNKADPAPEKVLGEIDHLIWKMIGVGRIEFVVTPMDDAFRIQVKSYHNQVQTTDCLLKSSDGPVFELVNSVFDQKRDLQLESFSPIDAAGTSMRITFVDKQGEKNEISNIRPTGELRPVYDFVTAAIAKQKADTARATNPYKIKKLIWETAGGGQIDFVVTPVNDKFEVQLSSYGFRDLDLELELSSKDEKAFQVVKAIFSEKRDLQKDTFVPQGATGSWTTLTLLDVNNKKTEFKNISSSGGDLRELYDFVAAAGK